MNGIDSFGSYLLLAATGWFLRARVTESKLNVDLILYLLLMMGGEIKRRRRHTA
jgi:hypothetical protein